MLIYEIQHVLPTRRGPRLPSTKMARNLFIDGQRLVPGGTIKVTEESVIINAPTLDRWARLGILLIYRRDDEADVSVVRELVSGDMLLDMWGQRKTEAEIETMKAAREPKVETPEVTPVVEPAVEEPVEEETTEAVIVPQEDEDTPEEVDEEPGEEEPVVEKVEETDEEPPVEEESDEESPATLPTKKELKAMRKDELIKTAEIFDVDVDDSMTRKDLIKAIGKVE